MLYGPVRQHQFVQIFSPYHRALDKLLGQLGIYATWLSSIAYLQKQLGIFIFFLRHVFFCDYTFSYCMKPLGMCLHIYEGCPSKSWTLQIYQKPNVAE